MTLIPRVIRVLDTRREAFYRSPSREREAVPPLSPNEEDVLLMVGKELLRSIEEWPYHAQELLDPTNVFYPRLLVDPAEHPEGRRMRRPRVSMRVDLTSAGNLVMEYEPVRSPDEHGWGLDFLVPPMGNRDFVGQPISRIVMLRGFGDLLRFHPLHPRLLELAELCRVHLAVVRNYLSASVEIARVSDLFVDTSSPAESEPIRIQRISERHEEALEARREALLERLRSVGAESLEQFLRRFQASGHKYKEFARHYQVQRSWRRGSEWETLRDLVYCVYALFPEEYDRLCTPLSASRPREMREAAHLESELRSDGDVYPHSVISFEHYHLLEGTSHAEP